MPELCACRVIDSWMSAPGKLTLQIEVDCTGEAETITTPITPESEITEITPEIEITATETTATPAEAPETEVEA